MAISVYREFRSKDTGSHIGSIEVEMGSNGTLHVVILGIHEDYPTKYGQALLHVTMVPDGIEHYDAITTIMEKITQDHLYDQPNLVYNDFILCEDAFVQAHPERCCSEGGPNIWNTWMPWTRENAAFLELCEDGDVVNRKILPGKLVQVYSQIKFIYDFPIQDY